MRLASIIIPTYNEKDNVPILVKAVDSVFRKNGLDYEILVIDDNSPDGTGRIAEELSKEYPSLKVLHREKKLGLGSAYKLGFRAASGDVLITMDADLSHDPGYIPKLLEKMDDADLTIASRKIPGGGVEGWGIFRRFTSTSANMLASAMLAVGASDLTSGFRAYKRSAISAIDLDSIKSNGYSFLVEIAYKVRQKGMKLDNIPFIFKDRTHGKSKLDRREMLAFLGTVFRLFIDKNVQRVRGSR